MLNKPMILKLVKWFCLKLNIDELLIAVDILCELINGQRSDIQLRRDSRQYPNYRKYSVDPLAPLTTQPMPKDPKPPPDYHTLLADHRRRHGRDLRPVRRRKHSHRPSEQARCPYCRAPHQWLYVNDGRKQNQLRCKICHTLFPSQRVRITGQTQYWCPYCHHALYRWKTRADCTIYKCANRRCPCRSRNLDRLSPQEQALRNTGKSSQLKICYQYREFHLRPDQIPRFQPTATGQCLDRIRSTFHTLGLVLTYSVSCGLSSRQTRFILRQVHQISISHQCILNYQQLAAQYLYPFIDSRTRQLTDTCAAGDETYLLVRKNWNFAWFVIGAQSRAILSFNLSSTRGALPAMATLHRALKAVKCRPLEFVADGNPAYDAAVHAINHPFKPGRNKITRRTVIGLTNLDAESETYRPFKQLVERLNRTFKFHVRARCGFKNLHGAAVLTTLFVTYYNFLRPHTARKHQPPIPIADLRFVPTLQEKWIRLLEMAA